MCKMPQVGKQGFCADGEIGEISKDQVTQGLICCIKKTEYF